MIVTTTHELQGYDIEHYYGIVVGEAVMGANVFRDLFSSIRDIVGGRSGSYEDVLTKARKIAFSETATINAGPINTLPSLVCLAWKQPNAKPSASVME